jgi:hypothetical protein
LKRASPIVGAFNRPKSRYALKPICRGQQKGSGKYGESMGKVWERYGKIAKMRLSRLYAT